MKREVVITGDGSSTIHLPEWDEQYHSKHGAIQEAYHVFIKHGLRYVYDLGDTKKIAILEIGFGTGLNAFISLLEADKLKLSIDYFGVEGYPVAMNEIEQLNYSKQLQASKDEEFFKKLHAVSWNESHEISKYFSLIKQNRFFSEINDKALYNLIYFDAFGARVQPELWTEKIFQKMFDALIDGGVLVTYAAKGSVRRAMQAVGFTVEKLQGPPGKREMLRATR